MEGSSRCGARTFARYEKAFAAGVGARDAHGDALPSVLHPDRGGGPCALWRAAPARASARPHTTAKNARGAHRAGAVRIVAKRSMEGRPHRRAARSNNWGANDASATPVSRERASAHTFAALRMYRGRMVTSLESSSHHKRRSSSIMRGDPLVSRVSTETTAWLSSCRRTRRPRSCGRKAYFGEMTNTRARSGARRPASRRACVTKRRCFSPL